MADDTLPTTNLDAANKALGLTPQEKYLYQQHLNNLSGAGKVVNPEGSISTLFQMPAEGPGDRFYNIPTVWGGKILSPQEATKRAAAVGWDKWPSYATEDEAESRYGKMHSFMDQDTAAYLGAHPEIKGRAAAGANLGGGWTRIDPSPAREAGAQQGLWTKLEQGPAAKKEEGFLDRMWGTLKAGLRGGAEGIAETGIGTTQLLSRAIPGQAGERARADAQQQLQQARASYAASPSVRAHPLAAGAGRIGGEALATAPLMMLPGGAAARGGQLAGRALFAQPAARALAGGALGGAAGAATQPVASGDYWGEKIKQVMTGAAVGAALPGIGSMISPRLPNPQLVDAATSRAAQAFRPIRNFFYGAEERTKQGFDRTIARLALEPVGGDITGRVSGHELIRATEDQIGAAYDRVLPHLQLPQNLALRSNQNIDNFVATLSGDQQQRYANLMLHQIEARFPAGTTVMDGQTFKQMESYLSTRARSWLGTNDADLGRAVQMKIADLRTALEQANPQFAPDLRNANNAWRIFAKMREAGARPSADGHFSPQEFLNAVGSQESERAMSRGEAVVQAYAEAAKRAMGTRDTPWELLKLFTRRGIIGEVVGDVAGPAARAAKTVAPSISPALGAVAGRDDSRQPPLRGDPHVSPAGP